MIPIPDVTNCFMNGNYDEWWMVASEEDATTSTTLHCFSNIKNVLTDVGKISDRTVLSTYNSRSTDRISTALLLLDSPIDYFFRQHERKRSLTFFCEKGYLSDETLDADDGGWSNLSCLAFAIVDIFNIQFWDDVSEILRKNKKNFSLSFRFVAGTNQILLVFFFFC